MSVPTVGGGPAPAPGAVLSGEVRSAHAAAGSEHDKYASVYRQLLPLALSTARRMVPPDVAMDVVQEVMLTFLKRDGQGRVVPFNEAVFIKAVTNTALRWLEQQQARGEVSLTPAIEAEVGDADGFIAIPALPDAALDGDELDASQVLALILPKLPPRMRECFLLVRVNGLSYKEAATTLGLSVSTVHAQLALSGPLITAIVKRAGLELLPGGRIVRALPQSSPKPVSAAPEASHE